MPLYRRIFIGMFTGFILGFIGHFGKAQFPWLQLIFQCFLAPAGQLFLQGIFMMVLPLVVCALTLASYRISLRHDMPLLATRAVLGAGFLACCAFFIAFTVAQLIPTSTLSELEKAQLLTLSSLNFDFDKIALEKAPSVWQTLFSKNPLYSMSQAFVGGSIAPVMVFSWVVGFSLARSSSAKTDKLLEILEAIQEACFAWIGYLMEKAAPIAVGCLIASSVQALGFSLIRILGGYVIAVFVALLIQLFVVYGAVLRFGSHISPLHFFKKISAVMLTAFSTSSSSATLPMSLKTAKEELHLDPDSSRMVLSFGASANQNGSALYEGITLLFLCHLFGVALSFSDKLLIMGMCISASFGTAGVPGGTLPLMASMLQSLGVPPSSLLLILGVDRVLDMARTVVNVTGDLVLAQWLNSKRM